MNLATLCILLRQNKVCLGMKKRGFGKGKYNGFGGKLRDQESVQEAAKRELREEISVEAQDIEKVAEMTYRFTNEPSWNQQVHVFFVREWDGEPVEGEEMTAEWFSLDKLPLDKMWDNDKHWLPRVLNGEKIKGWVVHDEKNTVSIDMRAVKEF